MFWLYSQKHAKLWYFSEHFIEMLRYSGYSTSDRVDCNGPRNGKHCDNDAKNIWNNTAIKHWKSNQKLAF